MINNKKEYDAYIEQKRQNVIELELNARYQKANYDTMYYALESDKLKEEYFALLDRNRIVQEDIRKAIKVTEETVSPITEIKGEE